MMHPDTSEEHPIDHACVMAQLARTRTISVVDALALGFRWAVEKFTPRPLDAAERAKMITLLADLVVADLTRKDV